MHEELVRMISSALLGTADLTYLPTRVKEHLGCSSERARYLIYQIVRRLNADLFPPIIGLELMLTQECNLACAYCFEKGVMERSRMPAIIARSAIDLLFDYSQDEANLQITHFGGEPLLNFPLLKYVTEYAEEKARILGKNVSFIMTSNGTLLNQSRVKYLADHKINVLLSIDGSGQSHDKYRVDNEARGSFERTMKGMRILKRFQPWIGIKMTVMPENVPMLFEDTVTLHDLGVNQFLIGYATGIKWSEEDRESFGEQMRKIAQWYRSRSSRNLRITGLDEMDKGTGFFGCRAGRNSISVSARGEISPCSRILSLNNSELLCRLGDVQYGLTHIINRAELISCSKLQSSCEALGIAEDFRGGCFAANYEENGDLFLPSIQNHSFSLLDRSVCSELRS